MSTAAVEPLRWSGRRWWVVLALVMAAQVGLIFWLGERKFATPRPPARAPVLSLLKQDSTELLTLNDPTLFALPQRLGFSGMAWLKPLEVPFQVKRWTEAPRFLALSAQELGGGTGSPKLTQDSLAPRMPGRPEPVLISPITGSLSLAVDHSTFRLEGKLTQRRLLTTFNLPSWSAADILTNTVVQLVVDARGFPLSASLLNRSGSKSADQFALEQATAARFNSLVQTGPNRSTNVLEGLSLGELIFDWHTLPPAATNTAPGSP